MTDRETLKKSLTAVRDAHRVLAAFHREVIGFFTIVDEQLGSASVECPLTPFDAGNFAWSATTNVKRVSEWVPSYLGRLYYDASLDVAEGHAETLDSRAAAFVGIYTDHDDGLPECWFGFGRPGEGTRYTDAWNFARNGLWNYAFESPPVDEWSNGTFDGNATFGTDGIWHVRRTPLIALTAAEKISELVTGPLSVRWKNVIRGLS